METLQPAVAKEKPAEEVQVEPQKSVTTVAAKVTPPVSTPVAQTEAQTAQVQTSVQKQSSSAVAAEQAGRPVFKVQLFALDRSLSEGNKNFKGLKGVAYYKEGNLYKYTYGSSTSIAEVRKLQREIAAKFPSAFVVAFVDGKRVDLKTAIKLSQNK